MFSEAEGNEVLLGLRKGSAKLSPQQGPIYINQRKIPTQSLELTQTLVNPNKEGKKVNKLLVELNKKEFMGYFHNFFADISEIKRSILDQEFDSNLVGDGCVVL